MSVWKAIEELQYHVADLKRRQSNFIRPAVVHQVVDPSTIVADFGASDAPALTHNVPLYTHGGAGKDSRPMKVGQQVTLLCPDGDLANAFALPGGYHDQNPPPSTQVSEDIIAQRGKARARVTDSASRLEYDSAYIECANGVITLHAAKIVLDGTYYLGGSDADKAVAMKGTVDTGGYSDISNLATTGITK